MKTVLFFSFLVLLSYQISVTAATPSTLLLPPETPLVRNPPTSYTVTAGDNVVDVVARFVLDPLTAVSRWQPAPQLRVGDRIVLTRIDNQPALQVQRGRTVKLTPQIRVIEKERGIPVIPRENIQQFLSRPSVVTPEELELSGYILDMAEERLLISPGQTIYVRGLEEDVQEDNNRYIIMRPGQTYQDPSDGEVLALEAIYLGDAEIVNIGDPATMTVISSERSIQMGDRLVPIVGQTFNEDFIPSVPDDLEGAQIIAVVDGVSEIGQFKVVVINRGEEDDIEVGNILAVQKGGEIVRDPVSNESVTLPDQKAATLLVFRPFERVSYALVMKAQTPLNVNDKVTLP